MLQMLRFLTHDWISWDDFWRCASEVGTTLGRDWMERMHSPARRRWLGRASAWRLRRFVRQVKELE
jgi:hypothetical protein